MMGSDKNNRGSIEKLGRGLPRKSGGLRLKGVSDEKGSPRKSLNNDAFFPDSLYTVHLVE